MSNQSCKQEPVFDLIKSLSKAEKRNFKLYATRLSGNGEAKFVTLFDCMESLDDYDEAKILQRCPIKKEQLPNMKAHLYRQILISLRLLDVQRTVPAQLREQLDFARILYDKGLYRQGVKVLEKAKEQALANEQHTLAIDIIDSLHRIDSLNIPIGIGPKGDTMSRQVDNICKTLANINDLSTTSMQLYSLYLQLGYARTQKDLDLISHVFGPKLLNYNRENLSFMEKFYLYQSLAWFHYIQHNLLSCYKYIYLWVELFDNNPQMKHQMYDAYLKGYSRLLDGLFLMRRYKRFVQTLSKFESECQEIVSLNDNARMISLQTLYSNRINKHFFEGTFKEGFVIVADIKQFIKTYDALVDSHHKMVLYYKVACLYFGGGDYLHCMEFLRKIITTRDPHIRRDLQCYARILNLICSYEAGIDYNIDYQVKAVYSFLVKMNDMQQVQREMMAFLKRMNSSYQASIKEELRTLYEKLKPLENHPYERRTFYYLDILSWLKSKIEGVTVAEVIHRRFLKSQR